MESMKIKVSAGTSVVKPSDTYVAETSVSGCVSLLRVESVADRLRWVLANRGLSGRGLSIKAQLSPNAVQKIIERGGSANGDSIAKLAHASGVSLGWLITGNGSPDDAPDTASPSNPVAEPEPRPAVGGSSLERALGEAFDPKRHTVTDLRSVQDALGATHRWERTEADLVAAARTWLNAAAALRREGEPVTAVALLDRVTFGKTARARELAAEREARENAEGDDEAEELGLKRRP